MVILIASLLVVTGCQPDRAMPDSVAVAPTEAPLRDLIIASSPEMQEEQRIWQRNVTEYHATLEAQYPTPIPGVGEDVNIE
jgi:hypothetical protein